MTEWFEQWFGEEYLRLYPHRDDHDARRLTELIASRVTVRGRRLLDLACGPGRHAAQFRRLGADVVGFDLSMPLLSRARLQHGTHGLVFVRGDMRRLPFKEDSFDVVVNLFTSFGYFTEDAQHADVLRAAAAILRVGGRVVLDFLNADALRRSLIAHEEMAVGAQRVAVERHITSDGRFVVKEIHLTDDGRSFVERVRLFSLQELRSMMEDAGLEVAAPLGDYEGRAVSETSPRVILIGERT